MNAVKEPMEWLGKESSKCTTESNLIFTIAGEVPLFVTTKNMSYHADDPPPYGTTVRIEGDYYNWDSEREYNEDLTYIFNKHYPEHENYQRKMSSNS